MQEKRKTICHINRMKQNGKWKWCGEERMENLCSGYCKICIAKKQKYGHNCTMLFYVSYDGWWWCAHCTRTFRAAIYRKLYASSALLSIAWCIMAWLHFGWLNSSFCQLSLQATIDYVHCIFTVAISVTSTLTSIALFFHTAVCEHCVLRCVLLYFVLYLTLSAYILQPLAYLSMPFILYDWIPYCPLQSRAILAHTIPNH